MKVTLSSLKKKSPDYSNFQFKQFSLTQELSPMKVGTDGVLLGAWVNVQKKKEILDIGTGTGVIAIMMAQRNTEANVLGIDIDENSSKEALQNMKASPFSNKLDCLCAPIQDFAWSNEKQFDLIVSNPPFFSGGTLSFAADRNDVRHTTKLSHGDLIQSVNRLIHPDGTFAVILPHLEGLRFLEFAQRARLYPQRVTEVLPKADRPVNRLLLSLGRERRTYQTDQIVIRESDSEDFTEDYRRLTKDFYLKF